MATKDTKKKAQRVTDLGQLPKGKLTVDDVIATNDINNLLDEIHSKRSKMTGLVAIWRDGKGSISYRYVKVSDSDVVAMCEIVKQHLIDMTYLDG